MYKFFGQIGRFVGKVTKKNVTLWFNITIYRYTMEKRLKVAAVQFNSAWESVQSNIETASEMVIRADADLVILPEMFATGFSMSPEKIAQTMDGRIVSEMVSLAMTSGKALIFSAAIASSKENAKYYNRLFFITPDGEYRTYDKRHAFRMGGEHEHYAEGTDKLIIEYKGFRICPLICYDLRFPVFSRCRNDYDLLIYIASWPAVRSYAWSTLLRARAIENQCFTIGVNRVGDDPKNNYSGDTVILGFLGKPIVAAEPGVEETIVAELCLSDVDEFRRGFPAHMDADKFEIL